MEKNDVESDVEGKNKVVCYVAVRPVRKTGNVNENFIVVTSDKIKKFKPEDHADLKIKPYNNPYAVLIYDSDKKDEVVMPATILKHSYLRHEVENPSKRYPHAKTRYSDAIQKLADEDDSEQAESSSEAVGGEAEEEDSEESCVEANGVDRKSEFQDDEKSEPNRKKATRKRRNEKAAKGKGNRVTLKDKETERQAILKKAQQILEEQEKENKKKIQMATTLSSYGLNLSGCPKTGNPTTATDETEINDAVKVLEGKITSLNRQLKEKDKKISELEISLVISRSKEEKYKNELDEAMSLLKDCIENNEKLNEELNLLKISSKEDLYNLDHSPRALKSASFIEPQKLFETSSPKVTAGTSKSKSSNLRDGDISIPATKHSKQYPSAKEIQTSGESNFDNEDYHCSDTGSPLASPSSSVKCASTDIRRKSGKEGLSDRPPAKNKSKVGHSRQEIGTSETSIVDYEHFQSTGTGSPIASPPPREDITPTRKQLKAYKEAGSTEKTNTNAIKTLGINEVMNEDNDHQSFKLKTNNDKRLDRSKKRRIKSVTKSLQDYDSDDYEYDLHVNNQKREHADFTAFTVKNDEGKEEKMFHLCYGYVMKYETWKNIRDQKSMPLHIKELALALWRERELVLRAVDLKRAEKRQGRATPRKAVTPKKAGIIRNCYIRYALLKKTIKQKELQLLKNKESKKLTKEERVIKRKLNGWVTHLSNAINNVYTQEKIKIEELNHKCADYVQGTDSDSDYEIQPKRVKKDDVLTSDDDEI